MIRTLLIANRGEIARRIMRTCRDLGITTVAVHSDVDADAPFVREADLAVSLGGRSPAESYLRIDAIVEAAVEAGADAVHPGYGFLSENAAFARACTERGLAFIGPPADAIDLMGSKLGARKLMQDAGVPVLPGTDLTGLDEAAIRDAADEIGWPVLVKASYGGGGRGMRVVRDPAELIEAVAGARREAGGAFGNDTVFLERYIDDPRHIEIQVFADSQGEVVSLFERECSIQRRHQKIIEEAPSPVMTAQMRKSMGDAAIEAARAIGYVGAGTVEFIVTPELEFFFLEMNTRLQVEHPVTELITGLDLVHLQIQVAEGAALPPEVLDARITGHAIETRLYAEDPAAGFLPASGTLETFVVPEGAGVRVDSGFESGSPVPNEYDPMLAKVITHGATRDEAIRKLTSVLRRARVDGVTTNRDLLVGILEHPEFLAGRIDTHFLERHDPADLGRPADAEAETGLAALAVALADQARNRAAATRWRLAPPGWRNNRDELVRRVLVADRGPVEVGYRLGREPRFEIDGQVLDVAAAYVSPEEVRLRVGRVMRRLGVRGDGESAYVDTGRATLRLHRQPRFPDPESLVPAGSLIAPMPGTVVRVVVSEGDAVEIGQPLVVLEAMKMEHEVVAFATGTVESVPVEVGTAVDTGQVLVVLKTEDEPAGDEAAQ
ncbi:MAG TPA: biotin carboxylase N-terminal domain-containing protein [Pseudonocardia sp.]|nr:biotin carboxylase N-terminal domain-containing protein [Pseudonocardia sp.]